MEGKVESKSAGKEERVQKLELGVPQGGSNSGFEIRFRSREHAEAGIIRRATGESK